jgi:hypothetical protein
MPNDPRRISKPSAAGIFTHEHAAIHGNRIDSAIAAESEEELTPSSPGAA